MDEKSFLNTIFPMLSQGQDVVVGPGDDCAAVDVGDPETYYLLAVDQVISGIHFDPLITLPEEAGAKLIKRNISDIASMGGMPSHALVTLAAGSIDKNWIERFYKGLSEEAKRWNVSICGGDVALLKKTDSFISTLTITGKVKKGNICLRKNMLPGDLLYVTGVFGNSYNSCHHLSFTPRVKEAAFLSQHKYTSAMMDVSDGLLLDLQRIAEASKVSIELDVYAINPRSPELSINHILSDGEDYELIFSVKPSLEKRLIDNWPFSDVMLTKIGKIIELKGSCLFNEQGEDLIQKYSKIGYDHFSKKS